MTEEPKKKKPGRDIGGISQYATFGSEEEEEEQESLQSTTPTIKQSKKPAIQRTRKPDYRITDNPDSQMTQYQKSQKAQLPDSQITGKQDKQMVSYLREKKPERKAQIAYLPLDLIKWLKVQAAQEGREISEIVADALELYRKQKS